MVENNTEFGFWDKIKYIFSDPNVFFEKVKLEQGIKNSLLMYAIVGAFFSVISYAFSFGMMSMMSGGYGGLGGFGFFYSAMPFISLGIGLIMTFLYSGLIHALIIAFKGEGTYSSSYNVYVYSMIPYLILSVVPMVGFLAIIYSIILMIIGLSKVHNISKGKAALACLLPAVLVIGLLIGLAILIFSRGFF
jgi:hypothetical protein|tara:strand:- start:94 stop:666 length:573 start_codon:yes stop_codon:yes gene_type:complete